MDTSDDPFVIAAQQWDVQRLYDDLSIARGKRLTEREQIYLRGLALSYDPKDIAKLLNVQPTTARQYCSELYRDIGMLLVSKVKRELLDEVEKFGVRANRVASLLAKAGYRLAASPVEEDNQTSAPLEPEALRFNPPVPSSCYGRETDLEAIAQAVQSGCRLVMVYGGYGIGKTTLLKQTAHRLKDQFAGGVWRSLQRAPTCHHLLADLLEAISGQPNPVDENTFDRQLAQLVSYLQKTPLLLVFEDADSLMEDGSRSRGYRQGYEAYQALFQSLGEVNHNSLILIDSWVKLPDLDQLESANCGVKSLRLKGLELEPAQQLLTDCRLSGQEYWASLVDLYRGNPYNLKVAAAHITEVFDGDVGAFCQDETVYLGNISNLLHTLFKRLLPLEQDLLRHLAIHLEGRSTLADLRQTLAATESRSTINEAIEALIRRSLIDRERIADDIVYSLPPVVGKYIKSRYST